jgi:hypothetical protein
MMDTREMKMMLWRVSAREKFVVVELTTWLLQVNAKSKSEWSAVGLGTHWRRRLLLRDPDPASELRAERERDLRLASRATPQGRSPSNSFFFGSLSIAPSHAMLSDKANY